MLPSSGSRRDRVSSYPKDMNVPVVVSQMGWMQHPRSISFFFSGFRSWGANVTDDQPGPAVGRFSFFFSRRRGAAIPHLGCPVMITGTLANDLGSFY